jgi:2,3,4,5-tetrahydropyridine-2,6-dicarboxylate N-succinyltransferase
MTVEEVRARIEALWAAGTPDRSDFEAWFPHLVEGLTRGEIRAAEPRDGGWRVNPWVKKGILLGFRLGRLVDYSQDEVFRFFDKDTFPPRATTASESVRIVPGGTAVRTGSYLAPGVVIMPPAYVNVGAYVGRDTMIDSHALVGSCAQVGERVHLSAAAQVGGVLEPVGALPAIIEDDVMVGGNCGIYEGTTVRRRAVIGAGTILTASIPVYDLVREERLRGSPGASLIIPEGAVVVPGTRDVGRSDFARDHGLSAACALIVKYRDERTDAATALEQSLR